MLLGAKDPEPPSSAISAILLKSEDDGIYKGKRPLPAPPASPPRLPLLHWPRRSACSKCCTGHTDQPCSTCCTGHADQHAPSAALATQIKHAPRAALATQITILDVLYWLHTSARSTRCTSYANHHARHVLMLHSLQAVGAQRGSVLNLSLM